MALEQRNDAPATAQRDRVVRALLTVGRHEILRHYHPASCIASTRVVIEMLHQYGYSARPVVVEARAYNRLAADAIESGSGGLVEGGYGISLGSDEGSQRGLHLVAVCEELLIDASLDQAARPGWNLVAYPSAFALTNPDAFVAGRAEAWFDLPAGGVIGYRALPGRRHYTASGAWGRRDAATRRRVRTVVAASLKQDR